MSHPVQRSNVTTSATFAHKRGGDTLADVLERVLDKGVVIVGDIGVNILDIELLTLKVRLLIASADTAREMGIDWWMSDPFLNSAAKRDQDELERLRARVSELEGNANGADQQDAGRQTGRRTSQRE